MAVEGPRAAAVNERGVLRKSQRQKVRPKLHEDVLAVGGPDDRGHPTPPDVVRPLQQVQLTLLDDRVAEHRGHPPGVEPEEEALRLERQQSLVEVSVELQIPVDVVPGPAPPPDLGREAVPDPNVARDDEVNALGVHAHLALKVNHDVHTGLATAEDDVSVPALLGGGEVVRGNDLDALVDGEGEGTPARDEGLVLRPVHHLVPDQRRVLRAAVTAAKPAQGSALRMDGLGLREVVLASGVVPNAAGLDPVADPRGEVGEDLALVGAVLPGRPAQQKVPKPAPLELPGGQAVKHRGLVQPDEVVRVVPVPARGIVTVHEDDLRSRQLGQQGVHEGEG